VEAKFPLPVVPFDETDAGIDKLLGELDAFVSNAVSYLVKISHTTDQDPKFPGRFTYQADLRDKLTPSLLNNYWENHEQPEYNLLRHNGAVYALSQAYHRNEERKKTSTNNSDTFKKSIDDQQDAIGSTIERAVEYLRDNALLPVPGHKDTWLAAWERTDPEDPHSEPETAKLGGAGLAMIALGKLKEIKPDSVCETELRKLGAFVEMLQDPEEGSFTCKYEWRTGLNDEFVSLYYPGEAALGLVTLAELELTIEAEPRRIVTSAELELEHQHHDYHHHKGSGGATTDEKNSKRWIRVATKALLYLEGLRRDQDLEEIEPDHWALLATARLLPILEQQKQDLAAGSREKMQADLEYWLIYDHGVRVANAIVADHTTVGLSKHKGCFTYDSRTCPTATRLEGLCEYLFRHKMKDGLQRRNDLTFLKSLSCFHDLMAVAAMTFISDREVFFGGDSDATELLKDRMERDVGMGIRFLLDAQQKNNHNEMRGAVPGMYNGRKPVVSSSRAGENSNDESEDENYDLAEVRVDYVQHSMSAVMAYEKFLLKKMEKQHKKKAFHEKVHEKVHKVVHHVKHKFEAATASSAFGNYCILGAVCSLVTIVVCLAYLPRSMIPFLGRGRRRKRRRVKRND
jgi:hypothetical protein